jgi:hypothetical protein
MSGAIDADDRRARRGRAVHALALTAVLAACGAPAAPRNRAGVFGGPGAFGGEYERFLDGDADHGSWSVGATAGLLWDADDLLAQPRKRPAAVVALNPFVRWHAYRPTEWLTLGLDGKVSLLWFLPDREVSRGRFALALESHVAAAADYQRVYALIGVGVKQFLFGTAVEDTRFPSRLTMPGGEASLGLRW